MGALGMLAILFAVMSVISGGGVILLFLMKKEKQKKMIFYFLVVWGIVITWMNVSSLPSNFISEKMIACGLGFLSVIALLIQLFGKTKNKFIVAQVLVALSVILSILDLLII